MLEATRLNRPCRFFVAISCRILAVAAIVNCGRWLTATKDKTVKHATLMEQFHIHLIGYTITLF